MFCVKGFVDGAGVDRYSGSAAIVIAASNIAAAIAAAKRAGSNVELQTFVTGRLWKEGLTRGIARKPIDNDWPLFPLWIKVPPLNLALAISSRRCLFLRLPPETAANQHTQPEGFMNLECLTALFAAGQAVLWILFIHGGDSHD